MSTCLTCKHSRQAHRHGECGGSFNHPECECDAFKAERRDLTPRGRAIRELYEDADGEEDDVLCLARAYDRGARDKAVELQAEFQAVLDRLKVEIRGE